MPPRLTPPQSPTPRRAALRTGAAILLALLAAPGREASAQLPGPDPAALAPATDIHDLLRRIRQKERVPDDARRDDPNYRRPVWLRMPFVASNPASGVVAGAGFEVTFFEGAPPATHASTMEAKLAASSKGQLVSAARFSVYSLDDNWWFAGENRLEHTSMAVYGLGSDADSLDAVDVDYHLAKLHEAVYRRVYRDLYLGVGVQYSSHTSVVPFESAGGWGSASYAAYSRANGFDPGSQVSAGTSVTALVDARDSSVNPTRGWLVRASHDAFFAGFLGGDSAWRQVHAEVRAYRSLTGDARHKLAAWVYGEAVTGGSAPFLDLPAIGGDLQGRAGRGYVAGRFRGTRLVYGELEYRGTLSANGLLGVVAFVNLTSASGPDGRRLFASVAPAGGAGLRILLDKLSRTNICFDVGVGSGGSYGIYIGLQEAF